MGVLAKLIKLLVATAALSQRSTNGNSSLGTFSAPHYGHFMTNNPLPYGYPWGKDTVKNTNPYNNSPNTAVTRKYNFTISRGTLAPDGYQRPMLLVNGQFPGPTIEANWGDIIQVTVNNNITSEPASGEPEGTSIHWHGFLQHNSQWMDGTSGFSQCPLAPSKSFTYSFKAELYGTTWYHAHYSAQYADGLVGPIVIHGPNHTAYDIDLGPVMLSDWYHVDYYTMVQNISAPRPQQPPPNPTSDNNLINGKMNFDCSTATNKSVPCTMNAGLSKFQFTTGKSHRIRLINTGADAAQQFTIDNHTMTVIANDFVPVVPYNTNVVTLGIGQRTDIIVNGTGKSNGAYWMRSNITCASSTQPNALAIIYYDKADTTAIPTTSPQTYSNVGCANDPLNQTVPAYGIDPGTPATTITLNMTAAQNASNVWLWYMNNSSFRTDYNQPTLLLAKGGNTSYPDSPEWNVYNTGSNKSYRFIVNNNTPLPHPMHYHGHNMFILAVGTGSWDGKTIINPSNPARRDVQQVPAFGYLVWQANADNPGVWPFHCHIAWHASAGLAIDIIERPADIKNFHIPASSQQVCSDWSKFSATGEVDQIDSGL